MVWFKRTIPRPSWNKFRCSDTDSYFGQVSLKHFLGFYSDVESAFPSLLCLAQPSSCLPVAVSQRVLNPKDRTSVLFLGPLVLASSDIE